MDGFASNLTAWRLFKKITQEELAQKAGIPRPNLSVIENGTQGITLQTLSKLSRGLGIKMGQLLEECPPALLSIQGRHQIDEIARAIVSGERPFEVEINQFADDMAGCIKNLLSAHGQRGFRNVKRRKSTTRLSRLVLQRLYGEDLINRVLQRTRKYLS